MDCSSKRITVLPGDSQRTAEARRLGCLRGISTFPPRPGGRIGYRKFAIRRANLATQLVDVPVGAAQTDPSLSARIDAVERTLDGVRKALDD